MTLFSSNLIAVHVHARRVFVYQGAAQRAHLETQRLRTLAMIIIARGL